MSDGALAIAAPKGGPGLYGADSICRSAALSAQLGGRWVAWASDGGSSAIDRILDVGPWYDLGGKKIFENRAGFMAAPLAALWLDESGHLLPSDRIWTGTSLEGAFKAVAGGCQNWTSQGMTDSGSVGQVGRQDSAWTAFTTTTCDQAAHLICLEQ
jgi:hypothetical protein